MQLILVKLCTRFCAIYELTADEFFYVFFFFEMETEREADCAAEVL